MYKYSPERINIFGYITKSSMKNQKSWDIANK